MILRYQPNITGVIININNEYIYYIRYDDVKYNHKWIVGTIDTKIIVI